jgi:hypothetical protein
MSLESFIKRLQDKIICHPNEISLKEEWKFSLKNFKAFILDVIAIRSYKINCREYNPLEMISAIVKYVWMGMTITCSNSYELSKKIHE